MASLPDNSFGSAGKKKRILVQQITLQTTNLPVKGDLPEKFNSLFVALGLAVVKTMSRAIVRMAPFMLKWINAHTMILLK